jgi:hypothetical protein
VRRHPGARHYFDCGGVIFDVLDVTEGGTRPRPGPKSTYFAVDEIDDVHTRAKTLKALAPFQVHGQPESEVIDRPWGERSFYVTDPWGNELCFVKDGTLYTSIDFDKGSDGAGDHHRTRVHAEPTSGTLSLDPWTGSARGG